MASDWPTLPVPARPFGADTLACALVLTGKATPTPAELTTALAEMYPNSTAPTVNDLLAAGWLVPTVDGRGLRQPPLPLAEQDARLSAANDMPTDLPTLPDSRGIAGEKVEFLELLKKEESKHIAGIKSEFPESLEKTESRNKAGIKPEFSESLKKDDNRREAGAEGPLFSYYRGGITSLTPYAAISPAQLFAVLTSERNRAATEALRAAPEGSSQRAEQKKRLDYVTPAGTFTRRRSDALAAPSGLLVLDFDHVPDVAAARAALLADELLTGELVLLFTSPSGDGLKVLLRTDPTAAHLDNFRAYAAYLAAHYTPLGLCPDEAGKDVARACFVPYAPDAWLAPTYAA